MPLEMFWAQSVKKRHNMWLASNNASKRMADRNFVAVPVFKSGKRYDSIDDMYNDL